MVWSPTLCGETCKGWGTRCGSGSSGVSGEVPENKERDYSPEFPLRLMSKDMDLVMNAARTPGAELPATSVAKSVLATNVSAIGDLDLSAITPFVIGQTRSKV